jgi:hypothetical protein
MSNESPDLGESPPPFQGKRFVIWWHFVSIKWASIHTSKLQTNVMTVRARFSEQRE